MHFEAMVRLQQKEELALHVKREEEAQALERIQRTAGGPMVSPGQGGRLYQDALERQAKLETRVLERKEQLDAEEIAGSTFTPPLSRLSSKLRTDGRPVEQRVMEWHELKQAKRVDAAAAKARAEEGPPRVTAARVGPVPTSGDPRPTVARGNPQFSGGKPRTVDDIA